jgi:hypothetical protein
MARFRFAGTCTGLFEFSRRGPTYVGRARHPAFVSVPPPPAEIVFPPTPSVCELSIGLRGHTIEASFGYGDRAVQDMGTALDRQALTRMTVAALAHESKARVLGREFAKRLPAVMLNALRETPTDRTMLLCHYGGCRR